jgi:hypothetical protein
MINVTVKEMSGAAYKLKNLTIDGYNSSANRMAQKIYKDLNNRHLKCPVCGHDNGTIIVASGETMAFSKTGFCHPEFANSFSFAG